MKFYTDKELCERWRCSPMKLWRLRQAGTLGKLTKIGAGPRCKTKNLTPEDEVRRVEEAGQHEQAA